MNKIVNYIKRLNVLADVVLARRGLILYMGWLSYICA